MRGSSFTTFLMFLPLIAIPLLAIFGIPEFRPVNASIPTEPSGGSADHKLNSNVGAKSASPENKAEDLLAPFDVDENKQSPNVGERHNADPFSKASRNNRLEGWEIEGRSASVGKGASPAARDNLSPFGGRKVENQSQGIRRRIDPQKSGLGQNGKETSLKQSLTWKAAVAQLKQWGISNFVLQQGDEPNMFHFSCLCPSERNARIVHRYEAEDAEPLQAVAKVLQQIASNREQY